MKMDKLKVPETSVIRQKKSFQNHKSGCDKGVYNKMLL